MGDAHGPGVGVFVGRKGSPRAPPSPRVDEPSELEVPVALRRSKTAAWAAFLAAVTSLLMPWWLIRGVQAGTVFDEVQIGVFSPDAAYSHAWLPYATGGLVLLAAGWMFVRIAGRSHLYEPDVWRRDLWIQAGIIAAALLSTQFWPQGEVGAFFETARFADNGTFTGTEQFERVAMAGLGFWSAALSLLCLLAAGLLARRR